MLLVPPLLTDGHLEAIAYWYALGDGPTKIRERLEEGWRTPDREVESVTVSVSAISGRLSTEDGQRRVAAWRRRLYGQIDSPLAFAGERLRRLDRLWNSALSDLNAATSPREASMARSDALKVLEAAQRLAEASKVELVLTGVAGDRGTGAATARLSGESLDALAEELARLGAAGVLPALAVGEAPGKQPSPRVDQG